MSKKNLPVIALTGRTNVGKSTLFNRLTKRIKSIVYEQTGITRDFIHEVVAWKDKHFDLVDTGGLSFSAKQTDPFQQHIQEVALTTCERAQIVIFIVDAQVGILPEDRKIAKKLHSLGVPVLVALNKCDNKTIAEEMIGECFSLGFTSCFAISSVHGNGIDEMLDEVIVQLPEFTASEPEAPKTRITLIGKPNVGKSSLMNVLLQNERSIVSDIAGTTRESVSERMTIHGEDLLLTDTAGVRRKRKVDDKDVESLMVKSSLASIRVSDIVVIMVDATEQRLSDQELKLLFYAFQDQHKGVILVFNKMDLMDEQMKQRLIYELTPSEFILKKIKVVNTSCETKKNVGALVKAIQTLHERLHQHFNSTEVNEYIQDRLLKKGMYHNGDLLRVYKIRFITTKAKSLTFALHVKDPSFFNSSHLGYLENLLRKKYDLTGCPIKFTLHKVKHGA